MFDQDAKPRIGSGGACAGAGKIDRDHLANATWVTAHHDNAVSQQHSLFNVMGDENGCFALRDGGCFAPYAQQLRLQNQAGLRIQRTQRFIE